jgi:hypothetical protein
MPTRITRREFLDHVIALKEQYAYRVPSEYARSYAVRESLWPLRRIRELRSVRAKENEGVVAS